MFRLSLIILTIYYINNVESRTCVCAEFMVDECEQYENCKWNTEVPSQKFTQGIHGVCRSIKWMSCHNDPLCTIKYRDPRYYTDDDIIMDNVPYQDNGHTPTEDDNLDWPWNCDSFVYADNAIDVQPLEIAAYSLYNNEKRFDKGLPVNTSMKSFSSTQIMFFVSFIILIIGGMVYSKYCKSNEMGKALLDKSNEYSAINTV
eukprot:123051_1